MSKIDALLEQAISLLEKEEKKEKKKKGKIKAKPGRGGVNYAVSAAKAIATKNPKKLMENLKIASPAAGKTDVERIHNLVSAAIKGTPEMREAYTDVSIINHKNPDVDAKAIEIETGGDIKARDAVMYIGHVLVAAESSGYLKVERPVSVGRNISNVMIFSGDLKLWKT